MNFFFIQHFHSKRSQKLFMGTSRKCHATVMKCNSCLITLQTFISLLDIFRSIPDHTSQGYDVLNFRLHFDETLLDLFPDEDRHVELCCKKICCSGKPNQFKKQHQTLVFISVPVHKLCTPNSNLFTDLWKVASIMILLNIFCSPTLLGR